MRALVTGATGFVGSNLVKSLSLWGHEVVAVGSRGEQELKGLRNVRTITKPFYELELEDLAEVDVLFHQAAIVDTRASETDEMNRINARAPRILFNLAIQQGCKKIVYASTTAVYGNSPVPFVEGRGEEPTNPYGKSKLLLDDLAQNPSLNNDAVIVGLRYCNIFGPGQHHKGKMECAVDRIARQLKSGENPQLFKWGEQKRDFIYIEDVVKANMLASKAKKSCVVNCGRGSAISFNEVVDTLQQVMGTDRKVKYIDMPEDIARYYQKHTECDMTLAREMIGFEPSKSFLSDLLLYQASGKLGA